MSCEKLQLPRGRSFVRHVWWARLRYHAVGFRGKSGRRRSWNERLFPSASPGVSGDRSRSGDCGYGRRRSLASPRPQGPRKVRWNFDAPRQRNDERQPSNPCYAANEFQAILPTLAVLPANSLPTALFVSPRGIGQVLHDRSHANSKLQPNNDDRILAQCAVF